MHTINKELIKIIAGCLLLMFIATACQNRHIFKTNDDKGTSQSKDVKLGAYYFDGWSGLTNYPHITKSLVDDYNEREPIWGWITSTPEIVKAQIDVAADAGIDFFSFCWYHSENNKVSAPLNRALNFYLDSENNEKMEFNLMVANHGLDFAIGPKNWEDVTNIWVNLMMHPQYLQSEGKPLITFFLISSLVENFGSTRNVKKALNQFRDKAIKEGLKGITIAACVQKTSEIKIAKEIGIDVLTAYNNHTCGVDGDKVEIPMSRLINQQEKVWDSFLNSGIPYLPAITLNWDPRPWEENKLKHPLFRMYYYTPYNTETVQEIVTRGINWIKNHPESTTKEKIITMYAWNENGEGGWLTPTKIGGDNLLKGVTNALSSLKATTVLRTTEKINRVVIIGNSITRHNPAPKKGWYGSWGMAASSESKDYVHQLTHKLKSKNKNIKIKVVTNGALNFEREFWKFDTLDYKEARNFDAEMILIRLGENINYEDVKEYDLVKALNQLINYINKDKKGIVVCTSRYWPNEIVDQKILHVCNQNNYPFVSLSGIFEDKSTTAMKEFENKGVGLHPSDKGMRIIAERIWEQLEKYFK